MFRKDLTPKNHSKKDRKHSQTTKSTKKGPTTVSIYYLYF